MTHREYIDSRANNDPCPDRLHQSCFECGKRSFVTFTAGQWYCADCGPRAVDRMERRVAKARATANAEATPPVKEDETTNPEPAEPPENVDSSPEPAEAQA